MQKITRLLKYGFIPLAVLVVWVCGDRSVSEPELARGKLVRLTVDGGTHPDWSDDGSLILYRYSVDDTQTIYSISPDGGQPTKILELTGEDLEYPRWHPDMSSQLIAFVLRPNRTDWSICTYDIGADKLDTLITAQTEYTGLDFTRDGNSLAFTKEPSSTSGIWLIPVSGGEAARIQKTPPWYFVNSISCDRSSDTISFLEFEKGTSAWNLFYISQTGGEAVRVSSFPSTLFLTDQDRSPGGGQYLIRLHNTQIVPYRRHIFLMPAEGGKTEQITTMLRNSPTQPTWSPDGKSIAFHRWEPDLQLSNIFYVDLSE